VKNVLGHLGLEVNRLIRVSFGPFQLADLAPGEIAEVKTRALREQLGERLIASAGADFSGPIGPREAPAAPPRPPARRDDKRKRPRVDPERIGQGEPARREKRRGRQPTRGERR
jgi:23S rRNA pseudouridine2605 synthase